MGLPNGFHGKSQTTSHGVFMGRPMELPVGAQSFHGTLHETVHRIMYFPWKILWALSPPVGSPMRFNWTYNRMERLPMGLGVESHGPSRGK